MNRRTLAAAAAWLISLVVFGLILPACSENFDDEKDPSLEDILKIGKGYLIEGNGASAADAFEAARKISPKSVDAKFGLMLAHTMQFTNLIDQIVEMFGEVDLGGGEKPVLTITSEQGLPIGDYLHDFLGHTIAGPIGDSEDLYLDLLGEPEINFDLKSYDLRIAGMELFAFGGEFDKTDLHFIAALNSVIDGLIQFLLAYDLNFDVNALDLPKLKPGASTLGTIGAYLGLVEKLLSDPDYPDFLYLDATDGAEHLKRVGMDFGNVFARLNLMLDSLAQETDPQQDDQVWFFDTDHDGRYDPRTDFVAFGGTVSLDPSMVRAIRATGMSLAAAFWDGSPLDIDPDQPNPLALSDLDELLEALGVLPIPIGPFAITGLPEFIKIDLGSFFSEPTPDGLRDLLTMVIDIYNMIDSALNPE